MVEESNIIRFCEDLADLPLLVERDPDSHGHLDSVPRPVHEKPLLANPLASTRLTQAHLYSLGRRSVCLSPRSAVRTAVPARRPPTPPG